MNTNISLHSFYRRVGNREIKLYGIIIHSEILSEFSVFSSSRDRFNYVKSLQESHGIDYKKVNVYNLWDNYIGNTPFFDYLASPIYSRISNHKIYVNYKLI